MASYTVREPGCSYWQNGLRTLGQAIRSKDQAERAGLQRAIIVAETDDGPIVIEQPTWLQEIAGSRIGANKAAEIQGRGMIV